MSIHTLTFEELAKSMERDLYLTCYGMLGHREDAADALQETMLRAWKGFHGFRGQAQWKTWFHRIAVNVCIDMLRKRKPETSLEVMQEDGFDPRDEHANVSADVEKAERDVRGMAYDELARVLRLPQGTVKSRLNRAREKLKRILSEEAELFDRGYVNNSERRSKR